MIVTVEDLKIKYANYTDINGKIKRKIDKGEIIPLVRGLYETDKNVSRLYLSSYIYGPSYISFDTALSYYGMIPEAVYIYTSATFNKRKTKRYTNFFGTFQYRDIPKEVYPFGIKTKEENGYVYYIATSEKALCDKLYIMPPVDNIRELKEMLFEDLRIEPQTISELNGEDIIFFSEKYHSKNLDLLAKFIRRWHATNN